MKVLIVDDKEENLYMLETLLKGNGFDVVSATNGVEALEKLKTESVGMIISDVLMPKMDGFQFCKVVKSNDKLGAIPFIFSTASYTDDKDEELALKLGAEAYIRKPIDPESFIKNIQGVINNLREGRISPLEHLPDEEEVMKLYNERLITKLEQKMTDLEREIIRRKKTEEILNENFRFLQALMDAIPLPVYCKDTNGYYLDCNRKFAEFFGFPKEQIISKTVAEITSSELADKFTKADHELFQNPGHQHYETSIPAADDKTRDLLVNKAPFYRQDGNIGGLIGTFIDITERKKMEKEIKKRIKDLENFYDMAIGRELKMIELKNEIKELKKELEKDKKGQEEEKGQGASSKGQEERT